MTNCGINKSVESIINKIKMLHFQNTNAELFEKKTLDLLTKLNLKSSFSVNNPTWFDNKQNEFMVLNFFFLINFLMTLN